MPKKIVNPPLGTLVAYLITNQVNGKRYVGVSNNVTRRWKDHQRASPRSTSALRQAFKAHGADAFQIEIIACCRTYEDLLGIEQVLIAQHGTHVSQANGYNVTTGGQGILGYVYTEADRAKMRGPKSPEQVAKMRGQKRSEETRAKLRRPKTESHKAALRKPKRSGHGDNVRASRIGFRHSEATKKNMSVTRTGKPRPPGMVAKLPQCQPRYVRPEGVGATISVALRKFYADKVPAHARSVRTPFGQFPSISRAAEHHGISVEAARYRARKEKEGWFYEIGGLNDRI